MGEEVNEECREMLFFIEWSLIVRWGRETAKQDLVPSTWRMMSGLGGTRDHTEPRNWRVLVGLISKGAEGIWAGKLGCFESWPLDKGRYILESVAMKEEVEMSLRQIRKRRRWASYTRPLLVIVHKNSGLYLSPNPFSLSLSNLNIKTL